LSSVVIGTAAIQKDDESLSSQMGRRRLIGERSANGVRVVKLPAESGTSASAHAGAEASEANICFLSTRMCYPPNSIERSDHLEVGKDPRLIGSYDEEPAKRFSFADINLFHHLFINGRAEASTFGGVRRYPARSLSQAGGFDPIDGDPRLKLELGYRLKLLHRNSAPPDLSS